MTPLLVLDSNVFISAILFGGKPRQILQGVMSGKFRMAVSTAILEEVEGVLTGPKFRFPPLAAREIISEIISLSEVIEPKDAVDCMTEDPADNRILECALASEATAILTGDNHLLALGNFRGIPIIKPAEWLEKSPII